MDRSNSDYYLEACADLRMFSASGAPGTQAQVTVTVSNTGPNKPDGTVVIFREVTLSLEGPSPKYPAPSRTVVQRTPLDRAKQIAAKLAPDRKGVTLLPGQIKKYHHFVPQADLVEMKFRVDATLLNKVPHTVSRELTVPLKRTLQTWYRVSGQIDKGFNYQDPAQLRGERSILVRCSYRRDTPGQCWVGVFFESPYPRKWELIRWRCDDHDEGLIDAAIAYIDSL
jgi:hypothetical protein